MKKLPLTIVRRLYGPAPARDDEMYDWREDAACLGIDTDCFYPFQNESPEPAKRICGLCSVRSQCLAYSLEMDDWNGIWGGMSEGERRRVFSHATASESTSL